MFFVCVIVKIVVRWIGISGKYTFFDDRMGLVSVSFSNEYYLGVTYTNLLWDA
jgi:hypothetical protein